MGWSPKKGGGHFSAKENVTSLTDGRWENVEMCVLLKGFRVQTPQRERSLSVNRMDCCMFNNRLTAVCAVGLVYWLVL